MKRVAVLTFVVVSLILGSALSRPAAQQSPSSWSEPVNPGAPINSQFLEAGAVISADGLRLYFASARPCGAGDLVLDQDLWVARRASEAAPWEIECLRINLDGYVDSVPFLSPDERWLYFVSDRPGSAGTAADRRDIWVSHRTDTRNDQAWSEPVNLGPPVNTDDADAGPAFFIVRESRYFRQLANQKLMFTSTRNRRAGVFDLWEVNILDGVPFGSARRLDDVSSEAFHESSPSVSPDGLELFFQYGPNGGPYDIYTSTRREPDDRWSAPVSIGAPVNIPGTNEQGPKRSPDGKLLLFLSDRPGTLGSLDIWVSTRIAGGRL